MPEYVNRTRLGLDAALRELLGRKPLDQLRVRELTEFCGLRRQSFYYHFQDVYDLFSWSMERERAFLLSRQAECVTWQQVLLDVLHRITQERPFYQAVLNQGGQEALGEVVPLEEVLEAVQDYYRKRDGERPNPEAEALERRNGQMLLLSLLGSWARDELRMTPEEVIASLERVAERSTAGAVWQSLRERGEWNWMP